MTNNYYQEHKERLRKEAHKKKNQNISEEEKDRCQKKAREQYQNLTEEEKEKKRLYHR